MLNVTRLVCYRALLFLRLHPVVYLKAKENNGPFFVFNQLTDISHSDVSTSQKWQKKVRHANPTEKFNWNNASNFKNSKNSFAETPWFLINDFHPERGDIKSVWEKNRFSWALDLALDLRGGNYRTEPVFNQIIDDWIKANPPFRGLNWKCAQEASIRVIHLSVCSLLLEQTHEPTPNLSTLLENHLARIIATTGYSLSQDNNHSISESVALFIGGFMVGGKKSRHHQRGRTILEQSVAKLVQADGSFSQHSTVYHRLLLDLCSIAEIWRKKHDLPKFTPNFYRKIKAATIWMYEFTDLISGDAPNLGHNDGSLINNLTSSNYRDFRPSLQLACTLFADARAIEERGPWDRHVKLLGIERKENILYQKRSVQFPDGGVSIIRNKKATIFFRTPGFSFRPAQSDLMHVDAWVNGNNILKDDGTYSYALLENPSFGSSAFHNTIEVDSRDQMPKIRRFLYGSWASPEYTTEIQNDGASQTVSSAFVDFKGVRHERSLSLLADNLQCTDKINGIFKSATLRWRLRKAKWVVNGNTLSGEWLRLTITADKPFKMRLVNGYESLIYLKKRTIQILEVTVDNPASIITSITFR